MSLGQPEDYRVIQNGKAEGELVGGNIFLIKGLASGKYSVDFTNKILFIEDLGIESYPIVVSNSLYYMKQNGVFDKIKGLWIGNYQTESGVTLEKIVHDVIGDEYNFPIIKSDNFGHIENKIVIPIGIKAKINTLIDNKIILTDSCVL